MLGFGRIKGGNFTCLIAFGLDNSSQPFDQFSAEPNAEPAAFAGPIQATNKAMALFEEFTVLPLKD
jgi:hypothetical protein